MIGMIWKKSFDYEISGDCVGSFWETTYIMWARYVCGHNYYIEREEAKFSYNNKDNLRKVRILIGKFIWNAF